MPAQVEPARKGFHVSPIKPEKRWCFILKKFILRRYVVCQARWNTWASGCIYYYYSSTAYIFIKNIYQGHNPVIITHLAEVDEEGAGGSIHSVIAIAGVWAPHLLHPLRRRRRGKRGYNLNQCENSIRVNKREEHRRRGGEFSRLNVLLSPDVWDDPWQADLLWRSAGWRIRAKWTDSYPA